MWEKIKELGKRFGVNAIILIVCTLLLGFSKGQIDTATLSKIVSDATGSSDSPIMLKLDSLETKVNNIQSDVNILKTESAQDCADEVIKYYNSMIVGKTQIWTIDYQNKIKKYYDRALRAGIVTPELTSHYNDLMAWFVNKFDSGGNK